MGPGVPGMDGPRALSRAELVHSHAIDHVTILHRKMAV